MTRLFQEIAGSRTRQQTASNNQQFIDQAAKQGFKPTVNDFMRFARMAKGRDMGEVLRELRQSGKMTDQQYEDLEGKAKGFMGLIGRFFK
ncbi:MAG: hypothetical protein IKH57_21170 [Clostridia bacterium]|nr:hypothetical protein [Clostridia bacterium]